MNETSMSLKWKGVDGMLMIKVRELVFDEKLYPREAVDQEHVQRMVEAAERGVEFPPIIAEGKTKRIVDGCHRHQMALRTLGPNGEVAVIFKRYANDQEFFLDCIRYNADHGLTLSDRDRKHSLDVAATLKISVERTASFLKMSVESAGRLTTCKIVPGQQVTPMTIAVTQPTSARPFTGVPKKKWLPNDIIELDDVPVAPKQTIQTTAASIIYSFGVVFGVLELEEEQTDPGILNCLARLREMMALRPSLERN